MPVEARQFYGTDKSYLVVRDYPLDEYIERLDFITHDRDNRAHGVVEIHVRGEHAASEEE